MKRVFNQDNRQKAKTGVFASCTRTYRVGLVVSQNCHKLAKRILNNREFFGVENLGLADKAGTAEGEVFLIRLR